MACVICSLVSNLNENIAFEVEISRKSWGFFRYYRLEIDSNVKLNFQNLCLICRYCLERHNFPFLDIPLMNIVIRGLLQHEMISFDPEQ